MLEEKLKDISQKSINDANQYLNQLKLISNQRDMYRRKIVEVEKDKDEEIGSLNRVIEEFKKKDIKQSKYKYINDSTKS